MLCQVCGKNPATVHFTEIHDNRMTEIHVCETLWPDFDVEHFEAALAAFAGRERRFGLTREQLRDQARGAAGGA